LSFLLGTDDIASMQAFTDCSSTRVLTTVLWMASEDDNNLCRKLGTTSLSNFRSVG
jgi:hypothetical protein